MAGPGVGRVMKLVRQVLGNWKLGKNYELVLSCDSDVMKMIMSADLGNWVQPSATQPSETGDRGHQGPRRRAGPSYLRRQEKRTAARAAASAPAVAEEATPSPAAAEEATPAPSEAEEAAPAHTAAEKASPAAAEEAAPAAAEEATATLSEVEEASLAPAADQAATTERTAPGPRSFHRCGQPCRADR